MTASEILSASSGGERFDTPGECKGSFMAVKAINGPATITVKESSNFRGVKDKNITIIEADTLWVRMSNPVLVNGSILAFDAV